MRDEGIEPPAYPTSRGRSTTELIAQTLSNIPLDGGFFNLLPAARFGCYNLPMPVLNTRLMQPVAALLYSALGAVLLTVFILIIGLLFAFGAQDACSGAGCGLLTSGTLVPVIVTIGLIISLYPILYWYLFSYELTQRTITVNSGILFRQYETIDFGRIQTIENVRGPLLMLFGLTIVKVWTASASQISFNVGAHSTQARPRPDTVLILSKYDAAELKDFMMHAKTGAPGL